MKKILKVLMKRWYKSEDQIPIKASSMTSLMLHRTIVVFTILMTGAVHSLPKNCWSKRCGKISQGREVSIELEDKPNQSISREERTNRKKRKFPLFFSLTKFRGKEFERKKISLETSKSDTMLKLCNFLKD